MREAHEVITDELGEGDESADRERDSAIDNLEYVKSLRECLRKGMSLSRRESVTLCEIAEELLTARIAE